MVNSFRTIGLMASVRWTRSRLLELVVPMLQHRLPGGSATPADDDATIYEGWFYLAARKLRRQLLFDAWPH